MSTQYHNHSYINSPVFDESSIIEDYNPHDGTDYEPPPIILTTIEKGAVGAKNIGTYGSFVYIINQIFGPGVLAIPIVFQQAGWVATLAILFVFCIISSFSATLLCEAVRMIPGNEEFQKRYEYTTTVRHYFGKKAYVVFQIFFNICLQSLNIASIIVCAQSMDALFVFLFKKSFQLQFHPHLGFVSGNADAINTWYSSGVYGITLGYIVIMALCIPMGMVNLDENIKFQWISFVGLVVLMSDFIIYFCIESPWYLSEVPAFGNTFTQVVSVCIFAWAFVMLVPSWVNEKKDHVSVNKTIWISALISTIGYAGIGYLCAVTFSSLGADDILTQIEAKKFILTKISAYLFSLFIIAPGIPVFCITTRYNLYIGGICGRKTAFFFGVIAPWIVGFIFTSGPIFADLLNWSALLFSGFVNFVLPFAMYIKAHRLSKKRPRQSVLASLNSDQSSENLLSDEKTPLFKKSSMNDLFDFLKPFPPFLRKIFKPFSIGLAVFMTVLIIAQIFLDLYYLIFKHEDVLGGGGSSNSTSTSTSTTGLEYVTTGLEYLTTGKLNLTELYQ